jgi:outer membrane protein assembly factor BamB
MTHTIEPTHRKPLRLWPGVVIVALSWLAILALPLLVPGGMMYAVLVGVVGGLAVLVWWLFFSRAPWAERLGAIVLMAVAVFATKSIVHASISNGMMGMMLPVYSIPVLSLALVAWAVATRRLSSGLRRASIVVAIVLACGVFTLIRTGGISGGGGSDLHWRWTPTPEQRLLAQASDEPIVRPAASAPAAPAPAAAATPVDSAPGGSEKPLTAPSPTASLDAASERPPAPLSVPSAAKTPDAPPVAAAAEPPAIWPGFRGPNRDGVVRGVRIDTEWSKSPPVELWRRPIGPGWSSFAVRGDLVYTQEQRGDDEDVSVYNLTTGKLIWRHRDAARFWESNGGAGPRGTPAVRNGRVYTLGATGILNALDASSGAVVWSRNAVSDTGATIPGWGIASSPLVINDAVVVAASGRLAAYDAGTGKPRWFRQTAGGGYSSPHLAIIDGVPQVVLLSGGGATGVAPADGSVLWAYKWEEGGSIVQPALAENGDVLLSGSDAMGGIGMRRLAIAYQSSGWTVDERWTSRGLKPYFNDFVVHKGHAFGFDGSILACIDLQDGTRKWKGGRYGNGQLVLLPDQDLLLVLSEEGELALVKATPDQFTELARFKAIEGKTWNHPVLAGDVLLVRNGEEMAAFRLALAGR